MSVAVSYAARPSSRQGTVLGFPPPVVIAGTGGSGTRVVARIVRHAGYDLGKDLNRAEDAIKFSPFHDAWINRLLKAERKSRGLSQDETDRMRADFQRLIKRHLAECAPGNDEVMRWGWKAPRSIYLVPVLHDLFPELKFIHVLRDGRDMALSPNRNQLRKHGEAALSWKERLFNSAPERSLLLWEHVNLRAAQYGETELAGNYHLVRLEDLCREPVKTTARILEFLDSDADPTFVARAEIASPLSVGRWRTYPKALAARLESLAQGSLRKFGYLD